MAAHKIYCTLQTLSEVIRLRKDRPYSSTFSVIDKLCDIKLECEMSEFEKLRVANPIINKLFKRGSKSISCGASIDKAIINPNADDIFLMTPPNSRLYSEYREKMGLLVTSSLTDIQFIDDLCHIHFRPYTLLPETQKQRLRAHEEDFEDITSWKEVFDPIKLAPINSAIIIDNYIFNEFEQRDATLYSIIRSIVPNGLKIPFHLTIFVNRGSDNEHKITKKKMEQVVDEIHGLNLGSEIKVSIIAHTIKDTTHDRNILTNFHIISSGKGFGNFGHNGVKDIAQGSITSTFHNINFLPSSATIKHQHSIILDWMRDIYIDKKGMNSIYAFEVGDKFDNRLLC